MLNRLISKNQATSFC